MQVECRIVPFIRVRKVTIIIFRLIRERRAASYACFLRTPNTALTTRNMLHAQHGILSMIASFAPMFHPHKYYSLQLKIHREVAKAYHEQLGKGIEVTSPPKELFSPFRDRSVGK